MANPQREDGHIDIANEVAEAFFNRRISGREWQLIWVILRKTWGWNKKMDVISKSQFADLTGIPRQKCQELLKGLEKKNIIKQGVTQKGNRGITSYGINKDYEKWKVLPKKVPRPQKGNRVLPKKVIEVLPKKVHTNTTIKPLIQIPKDSPLFFDIFWDKYPKKVSKQDALKTFTKINPDKTLFQKIVDGLNRAVEFDDRFREKRFTPHPATWLNKIGWEDEHDTEPSLSKKEISRRRAFKEFYEEVKKDG